MSGNFAESRNHHIDDASMFEQEEPEGILPPGYSVSITYATVDDDPGDPEVGPSPNINTRPVYWEFRNSAMGEGIVACVCDSQAGEWVVVAVDGEPSDDPQEIITAYFAAQDDEQGRRLTLHFLHQSGLI